MKIAVITDGKGKVLGTMRSNAKRHEPMTSGEDAGQKVTEIEIPDEVANGPAEELHKAVERHLKK